MASRIVEHLLCLPRPRRVRASRSTSNNVVVCVELFSQSHDGALDLSRRYLEELCVTMQMFKALDRDIKLTIYPASYQMGQCVDEVDNSQ